MAADSPDWDDSLGGIVALGDVIDGRYRIVRVVGRGGMGVVTEAWHLQFEERVALKVLTPQLAPSGEVVERFLREARAAFKIQSEHVARVLDVGTLPSGSPYLVMEYLEGSDLADVLLDRAPLPIEEAVGYVLQACEAMAHAHARGIVHRDLKPENLFLAARPDGSAAIKILDFGISKIADAHPDRRERSLTADGAVMGSPCYIAPEQWLSARDAGPAADQWALGAILFELLTGHPPYFSRHVARLCGMVLNEPTPSLRQARPGVPEQLEQVVDRCLRKDPLQRYESVADLALALLPFGPRSVREPVRRAISVLQRAGMASGELEMPPSVAAPAVESTPAGGASSPPTAGTSEDGVGPAGGDRQRSATASPWQVSPTEGTASRGPSTAVLLASIVLVTASVAGGVFWALRDRGHEASPAAAPATGWPPVTAVDAGGDAAAAPQATGTGSAAPGPTPAAPSARGDESEADAEPAPAASSSGAHARRAGAPSPPQVASVPRTTSASPSTSGHGSPPPAETSHVLTDEM